MSRLYFFGICLALSGADAVARPGPTHAQPVIAARLRENSTGLIVQVIVPQTKIETSVDTGRIASPPGGGLLGAIIIASTNDSRKVITASLQEQAETTVAPLREALGDLNVDALAIAATSAAIAKVGWPQVEFTSLTKDATIERSDLFGADSPIGEVMFIEYRYELSPDFSSIRVDASVSLAGKGATGKAGKIASPTLLYRQNIVSIVQLEVRSNDAAVNVSMWSANDGKRAKAALVAAFGQMENLIPYALNITPADLKALTAKGRDKGFAAGFYGPRIDAGGDALAGLSLWSDGPVHVLTIP